MALPKEIVTEAIRYWEPRRVVYNLVLLCVTLFSLFRVSEVVQAYPPAGYIIACSGALLVGANLCYCAAYTVDIFIQQSDFQESWKRHRPLLFIAGTAFAALLAFYLAPFIIIPDGYITLLPTPI